jgi:hypothetical protein
MLLSGSNTQNSLQFGDLLIVINSTLPILVSSSTICWRITNKYDKDITEQVCQTTFQDIDPFPPLQIDLGAYSVSYMEVLGVKQISKCIILETICNVHTTEKFPDLTQVINRLIDQNERIDAFIDVVRLFFVTSQCEPSINDILRVLLILVLKGYEEASITKIMIKDSSENDITELLRETITREIAEQQRFVFYERLKGESNICQLYDKLQAAQNKEERSNLTIDLCKYLLGSISANTLSARPYEDLLVFMGLLCLTQEIDKQSYSFISIL